MLRPGAPFAIWLLSAATLSASCGDMAAERAASAPAAAREVDHALEALGPDEVWITTGQDSVELVERVLGGVRPLRARSSAVDGQRDGVALRVPRAALVDISEIEHEERHRCGGFMLHGSEAEALEMLRASEPAGGAALKLAPSYAIDNEATVEALLPTLEEANVLATIRALSAFRTRFHTSMTGQQASVWIRDTWQALAAGRDDIEVALVDHEKTPQPSIKMTIRGKTLPDEIVVLGGHMDSIVGRGDARSVAPGADDNASGIATLTEIARAAIALDYHPDRTVVFYGYAAEEIGLVGSAEIAAQAKADGLDVVGVMQVDMTNYTSARAPYIGLVSDFTDQALNGFSAELIERYLDVPYKYFECGYACSDHASWTKHGFAAVSPHEADMEQGNSRIHTASDTLALSNDSAAHAMHFVRFGVAFMAELAKGELVQEATPACSDTKPCESGQRCESGECVPSGARDPDDGAPPDSPDSCRAAADCAADQRCEAGRCTAVPDPSDSCSSVKPCASGLTCRAGTCSAATGDVPGGGFVAVGDAGSASEDDEGSEQGRDDEDGAQEERGEQQDEAGDDARGDGDGEVDYSTDRDAVERAAAGDEGCSASGSGSPGSWLWLLAATLLYRRRLIFGRSELPTWR